MKCIFKILMILLVSSSLQSCKNDGNLEKHKPKDKYGVEVVVLGTVQDAGSPQIGCMKVCCADLWENPDPERKVVSLGIIDHDANKTYMIEASPDFKDQLYDLNKAAGFEKIACQTVFF